MIFVVQRIQKDKLAIFNINHEYKPTVIDANWEVQIVGMIKRSTPRGSFESTSYGILVGIIKILVQVLTNVGKKIMRLGDIWAPAGFM